jgi:hypothetical protein
MMATSTREAGRPEVRSLDGFHVFMIPGFIEDAKVSKRNLGIIMVQAAQISLRASIVAK